MTFKLPHCDFILLYLIHSLNPAQISDGDSVESSYSASPPWFIPKQNINRFLDETEITGKDLHVTVQLQNVLKCLESKRRTEAERTTLNFSLSNRVLDFIASVELFSSVSLLERTKKEKDDSILC